MKSLAELQALREQMKGRVGIRHDGDSNIRVVVGMATCGIAAGARPTSPTRWQSGASPMFRWAKPAALASASTSRWWRSSSPARKRPPM